MWWAEMAAGTGPAGLSRAGNQWKAVEEGGDGQAELGDLVAPADLLRLGRVALTLERKGRLCST